MNLRSYMMSASGVVRDAPGRLAAIHANGSTGGKITLVDGVDASGETTVSFELPVGFTSIEVMPFAWRFTEGCYIDFGAFVGEVTLSFC